MNQSDQESSPQIQQSRLAADQLREFPPLGASMLAYYTNSNVPEMARILRHRSWKSTQKYVHTIEFKD